jgi:hypothetical protein
MRNVTELGVAAQQYAAAHAVHHTTKDLGKALGLYRGVMAEHPNTQEAGYSHTQIQNIVNRVVPKQDLLDAQVELALDHLAREERPDAAPVPVTSLASAPTS